MVNFLHKEKYGLDDLISIMKMLRSEDGCPWDKEQTHSSIKSNFIEEAYEVLETIENDDASHMKEELGDVLLQVVFHSQIEDEKGNFNTYDVCDGICKKLINRHPHIFDDKQNVSTAEEVAKIWEEIKKTEKGEKNAADFADDVCKALPALMQAQKVQNRIADAGFDCDDIYDSMSNADHQLYDLQEIINEEYWDEEIISEQIGNLLLSCVNIARFADVDPEFALKKATQKFVERFKNVEQLAEQNETNLKDLQWAELSELWEQAKEQ